jgi:hypothetical protein
MEAFQVISFVLWEVPKQECGCGAVVFGGFFWSGLLLKSFTFHLALPSIPSSSPSMNAYPVIVCPLLQFGGWIASINIKTTPVSMPGSPPSCPLGPYSSLPNNACNCQAVSPSRWLTFTLVLNWFYGVQYDSTRHHTSEIL